MRVFIVYNRPQVFFQRNPAPKLLRALMFSHTTLVTLLAFKGHFMALYLAARSTTLLCLSLASSGRLSTMPTVAFNAVATDMLKD